MTTGLRAELAEVEGWLWDIEAMRAAGVSPAAVETARDDVLARREELRRQIREDEQNACGHEWHDGVCVLPRDHAGPCEHR